MALHVYNTRTKRKEPFVPAQDKVVRIYTCGLTVYSDMHIGHARTYCFWDVFRRWLEYRGYHVVSVINYTDIDDRIISDAAENGTGELDHAERVIASFRRDCRTLKIMDYAAYTRATDFVDEQIEAVQALLDAGLAEAVGQIDDIDAGAAAHLQAVQAVRIVPGLEHDFAAAHFLERVDDDLLQLVAIEAPPGDGEGRGHGRGSRQQGSGRDRGEGECLEARHHGHPRAEVRRAPELWHTRYFHAGGPAGPAAAPDVNA